MPNENPNLTGLLRGGSKAAKKDDTASRVNSPIDFSHIGGKKVGHPAPVKTEEEISFEHLRGKVVRSAKDHPMAETAESVEKEDVQPHASATSTK